MKTYIALLRGINVGGHKKFPKAEQLEMLNKLGFKNSQVYIHTGNWVFESNEKEEALSLKISEAITQKHSWEVPIVVITALDFKTIFNSCPWSKEKKEKSYFTLLATNPAEENKAILNGYEFTEEEWHLTDKCLYFFSTISAARVKMNNNFIEQKLKVSATSRNYKTMAKLIALLPA